MPRTLEDIFNENCDLEVLEVVGYDDGKDFCLSADSRKLKILDACFAKQLAELPGADTEGGYITDEGYCIRGGYNMQKDSYKVTVRRSVSI